MDGQPVARLGGCHEHQPVRFFGYEGDSEALMARRPQKRQPKYPNYEHITLRGSGFWILPDLLRCEGVERGRWTNVVIIRASTFDDRRLLIPLLDRAVASFVAAPPIAVPFERPTQGRQIAPSERGKILEMAVLHRFVCFCGISTDW